MNFGLVLLTGLTTGGISCVAVQGGLLASLIANQPGNSKIKIVGFLLAKLVGYSLLGALLGFIGTAFQINLTVILIFQTIAALYLIASALNLLEVHPIFRCVVIQPPKAVYKLVKKSTRLTDWFAPVLLGLFTVLIPCGVTQAMEVNAMSSGSFLNGALTMFFFILGTMPLFIIIGLTMASLPIVWRNRLYQTAAILLIVLGLSSLNGVLTVLNSPLSVQGIMNSYKAMQAYEDRLVGKVAGVQATIPIVNGVQKVAISITPKGYEPAYMQVRKDVPIELTLTTKNNYTCANYFVFKAFNISARMQPSETRVFNFVPNKAGRFTFSCSMGMYNGIMEVI